MSTVYKVSFTLTIDDETKHPSKWIPNAVDYVLEDSEIAEGYVFEKVDTPESQLTK